MEQDYLLNVCRTERAAVELGAPSRKPSCRDSFAGNAVVFFSEPYESLGGRALEFYRDVLPRLAQISASHERELVIKLHPAETLRQRRRLAHAVLSKRHLSRVRFVAGPITDELFLNTWFAVTVLSTTAMECTLRGIPAFLCGWLDYSSYEYLDQMAKFGAGQRLEHPADLLQIPKWLESAPGRVPRGLWNPIDPERLEQLFWHPHEKIAAAV